MAGLEKVSKGQKLRVKAQDWNTFVDVANHVRQRMMNQGSPADRLPDDTTPFKNSSGTDMPQYGIGCLINAAFKGLSVVGKPPYPGISRIIIASKPSAANGLGAGWTGGIHPVRVASWSSISIGDRLGTRGNSWDAWPDPLGSMVVIGKLDSPLVAVLITGQRGDHKMIKTGPGATDGRPIKVLLLSRNHTVTQVAPNQLRLTYVASP